jgi:hypothetical protein
MDNTKEKKRACDCCHGKEYGANLQGDVVIGCTEDNIWCNDSIAEKCPLYKDKNEVDNYGKN